MMKQLAAHPLIDLTVYYMNDLGLREREIAGYGKAIKWDVPLLDGYRYQFLRNWSWQPDNQTAWSSFNPGIATELAKHQYDALLILSYYKVTDIIALIAARITRTPVIFRGDVLLNNELLGWKSKLKEVYLRLWCQQLAAVMPIGTLAEHFYKHFGVPERKMFRSIYAVNNEFFIGQAEVLKPQQAELKQQLGIPPDMPVVLFVALMRAFKRPLDILKAFTKANQNAALVVVGEGPEYPNVQRYCQEDPSPNIYLVGTKNQQELSHYYAMADIFVVPSGKGEAWCLVINEAMCFSLPIIATDAIPAAVDLVQEGKNGFIYSVGDIEQLSEKLIQLLTNHQLRAAMSKSSLQIIGECNYEANAEAILQALAFATES
ncbi:MAG: glycosyltransferase family 4 protein [Anaerolineales bacterium]|nr:glycosyltransferase family 4 protein [Anaerolineales bacterium]